MLSFAGELAALATAVCWSFTALFFSYGGRRVGSDVVNRTRLIFAMVWIGLTHWALYGTVAPASAEPFRWGWLALSGILGLVIGDAALFQAYVLVGPRLAMLMMSFVPILSTLFAWALLGETVTVPEIAGIGLTVSAVAWVVTERHVGGVGVASRDFRLGIALGAVGAVGQAANLITARFGLVGDFPTLSASFIRILVAAAILWSLSALRGDVGRTVGRWRDREAVAAIAAGSVVGPFLGIWFSLVAIDLTRVGIASTIMALPPVLLIPLGYVVHRERASARAVIGTLAAFAGVALIFLA